MKVDNPHHLYRHFDKKNVLLYVGISFDFLNRLGAHKHASHWFCDIASVTVEHFKTRELAEIAEQLAIKNENPLHNIRRPINSDESHQETILLPLFEGRDKTPSVVVGLPNLALAMGQFDRYPAPQQVVIVEPLAVRETIASAMLGIPMETLRLRRKQRTGPPFRKDGSSVIYLVKDLRAWVESLPAPQMVS
jgi:hypothetical protein